MWPGSASLKPAKLPTQQQTHTLSLLALAATQARKPIVAEMFARISETLCKTMNKPFPFAMARRRGDSARAQKPYQRS
ncbi:MAG: hypothetical protein CMJ75_21095 [Planctomycetaceae bacterium]|nr:hypothetical protein [Planctomycetaceae bacterium]